LRQPIHEYHAVDAPKHSEHCFCRVYHCPRSHGNCSSALIQIEFGSCLNKFSFHPLLQCPEIQFIAALPASREGRMIPQLVFDEVFGSTCMAPIWNAGFWTEMTLSTDARP
jgi:hypothetical protein